jgi:hypothetical protein
MSTEADGARPIDPGLEALVTLLHLQGVAADAEQIRHRLGTDKIGASEMLRCARDLGLKARVYRTDWLRLARTPLPAIATLGGRQGRRRQSPGAVSAGTAAGVDDARRVIGDLGRRVDPDDPPGRIV